eukprot:scaffold30346_cov30-Tisochrysis_lutea.AAC.3
MIAGASDVEVRELSGESGLLGIANNEVQRCHVPPPQNGLSSKCKGVGALYCELPSTAVYDGGSPLQNEGLVIRPR